MYSKCVCSFINVPLRRWDACAVCGRQAGAVGAAGYFDLTGVSYYYIKNIDILTYAVRSHMTQCHYWFPLFGRFGDPDN